MLCPLVFLILPLSVLFAIFPGLFILAIALTVNFIGDGLRDAFDPRQNRNKD